MSTSPTQRTLAECRRRGWEAQVVESFNSFTQQRRDLFGFGDVIALDGKPGAILIQATSGSNGASRRNKILEECRLRARAWVEAGNRVEVWAWKKYAKPVERKYWRMRVYPIGLEDLS